MAGSLFDSALFARLFPTGEAGRLFTDTAEVRAMLLVEGALARVQGSLGVIPEVSAAAIHRASLELQIDPGGLAEATGQNGVPVPGLVAAFRTQMNAPEHAQYVHWGATSQDIVDTGLMLRLRQLLSLVEADLRGCLSALAALADTHAETPMAARTWGQVATPTSFGAVAASWGAPLLELLEELLDLRARHLLVSLSGAAGTSAALGPQAAATRAGLAESLGLKDPERSWHTDRGPVLAIASWLTRVSGALAKLGADLVLHVQTGISEVRLGDAGASSTMPQKQNPVQPSALVALGTHTASLNATLTQSAAHAYQRDGANWFAEWLSLPQLCLASATGAKLARSLCEGLQPDTDTLADALHGDGLGLLYAEALSFALATHMPRPDAQAAVKALCAEARDTATPLANLVARDHPELAAATLFDPVQQMGSAPADARTFAARVADQPDSSPA